MNVINEGDKVIINGESHACVLANNFVAAIGKEHMSEDKIVVIYAECKVVGNSADSLKEIGVEKIIDRYGKEKPIEDQMKYGKMGKWEPINKDE